MHASFIFLGAPPKIRGFRTDCLGLCVCAAYKINSGLHGIVFAANSFLLSTSVLTP